MAQPSSDLAGPPARGYSLSPSSLARLTVVTVLTGIGAGLGGMLLALLLHAIQHLAYGYSLDRIVGGLSFFAGVSAASPPRRVTVLLICGLVAGVGWYLLYRFARPLVSIKKAISARDPRMPVISTVVHALLQIVTVALGCRSAAKSPRVRSVRCLPGGCRIVRG